MATIAKRTDNAGAPTYQVKVRLKGYPGQTATFTRLTDAKKWATQTEADIRAGRHFKTTEAKRHTLADLVHRYTRDVLPGKGTQRKTQAAQLAWWTAELGPYSLADVTPARIAETRDKLARIPTTRGGTLGPATVNRYLAALSHAFTIAVKEWGWVDSNPLAKVTKPKEPRGRIRFLSDDERNGLLTACRESASPDLYPAVVLALSTGARAQELLGLRWPQVDPGRKVATLYQTKNGETRVLPLSSPAPPWSCCASGPRSGAWIPTWCFPVASTRATPWTCGPPSRSRWRGPGLKTSDGMTCATPPPLTWL